MSARAAGLALAALGLAMPAAASAAPAAASSVPSAPHVTVETLTAGQGDRVAPHAYVLINYKGMLKDGTVFDQASATAMALDEVVPGFTQGIIGMQRGGKYRLTIPPELGYGAQATGPIPANSVLVFEVDLLDFKTAEEIAALIAQQNAQQNAAPAAP